MSSTPDKLALAVEAAEAGVIAYPDDWGRRDAEQRTAWAIAVHKDLILNASQGGPVAAILRRLTAAPARAPQTQGDRPQRLAVLVPFWSFATDPDRDDSRADAARETIQGLLELPDVPDRVTVFAVEVAWRGRPWRLDHAPRLRLRARDRIWPKEAALNAAARRLDASYSAVAWIDGDMRLSPQTWPQRALGALSGHLLVQLFGEVELASGSMPSAALTIERTGSTRGLAQGHTGFAWAARRELWDHGPGLLAEDLSGAGDVVMAAAACQAPDLAPRAMRGHAFRWMELAAHAAARAGVALAPTALPEVTAEHRHVCAPLYREARQQAAELRIGRDVAPSPDGLWEWTDRAPPYARQWLETYADRRLSV